MPRSARPRPALPGDLHGAAAAAAPLAAVRCPLPMARRPAAESTTPWLVMAGLAAGVVLLVLLGGSSKAAGLAWLMFAGLFGLAAAGLMLTTNPASRANAPARPFLLYLGALLAAATIAVWLSTDRAALRLLLSTISEN